MINEILSIKELVQQELEKAADLKDINAIKIRYLGKKGLLTEKIRSLGSLSQEERAEHGRVLNETKGHIEAIISEKEGLFKSSDLEKTIIDCLFKPDYAGGIVEIARAVYLSRKKIRYDFLLGYAIKFNTQAVLKRLGFLLETLEIKTEIIEAIQKLKTKSIVLLDTELPKSGKIITKWSIQQNIGIETIKEAIYT